jgi:phosphatidylinositol glycan class B
VEKNKMTELPAQKETILEIITTNAGIYDKKWLKFVIKWSIFSVLILFVTAFFSLTYYQADEYWQTIEFAALKLGKTRVESMPWEYSAKMRPWLQPAIYVCIAKIAGAAGITDPFKVSMFFRFFSALCGALMCVSMMFCSYLFFYEDRQRKAAVRTICLLGFLPFMLVRTSSEALSSSFSMAGLALLMLGSIGSIMSTGGGGGQRYNPRSKLFITGVLWGIAFEFRYQCAFLVAGFVFWMVFMSIKNKITAVRCAAVLFSGIFISILICTFIDIWGYGEFVFAPWNYLYQNIFLHKADNFGTLPFWGYARLITKGNYFISPSKLLVVFLTAGTICAWIRCPRHPLTWGTVLFFAAHCFVSHKELRFLMNMAVPAIILTVYAFSPKNNNENSANRKLKKIWQFINKPGLLLLFYAFNICLLLFYTIRLNKVDWALDKYMYHYTTAPFYAFSIGGNPYVPWKDYPNRYSWYKPENITVIEKDSIDNILLETGKEEFNLIVHGDNDNDKITAEHPELLFTTIYRTEKSGWFEIKNIIRSLLGKKKKEGEIWTLYLVKNAPLRRKTQ